MVDQQEQLRKMEQDRIRETAIETVIGIIGGLILFLLWGFR